MDLFLKTMRILEGARRAVAGRIAVVSVVGGEKMLDSELSE